ncbi:MAG TPA: DUF4344 domain-containing metallopeptidase, partial [Terriglobia bacterium]|nr:DUF4344 domain-containing metallopeptidase [Terriglobia bacterium]
EKPSGLKVFQPTAQSQPQTPPIKIGPIGQGQLAPLPGPSTPLVIPATRSRLGNVQLAPATGQFLLRKPEAGGLVPATRADLFYSGALQGITNDLNKSLKLPRNVPITLRHCGQVNAFYSPASQEITLCDEWFEKMDQIFKSAKTPEARRESAVGATAFVFAHEVGHALIHQLQIKYNGQQETVADQYAVYLLSGSIAGEKQIFAAAEAFGRLARENEPLTWDNHPLDEQRRYNIYCWVYGMNPPYYGKLVTDGSLPAPRAKFCPGEARDMIAGLDSDLRPHMR